MKHGLSNKELQVIKKILSTFWQKIDKVGLFGSRANGKYKEYSDIDLVVYGDISEQEIDRLNTLVDESNIGLSVDIKAYNLLGYLPLKRHIDNNIKTLFTQKNLKQTNDQ